MASFSGSSGENFGESVALSADGREALVGAQFANSAYLFAETAGTWRTTPMATLRGGSGGFGSSVALSADGREALVGAPFTSYQRGGGGLRLQGVGSRLAGPAGGDFERQQGRLSRHFGGAVGRRPGSAGRRPGCRCRFAGPLTSTPVGRFLARHPHSQLPEQQPLAARASAPRWRSRATARWRWWAPRTPARATAPLTFTPSGPVLGPPPHGELHR